MTTTAVPSGFKQSEAGLIPVEWNVRRIGEFLQFYSGKAHEPYVSRAGNFVVVNSKFISTDGRVRKHCTKNLLPARAGDVLMVMSDLPNGRALAKCFLVDKSNVYAVNQRVCIFRSRSIDPRYLRYVLNRNPYFMAFDDGVQQTHLLNGPIKNCPVVLPEREEQRAIADAVSDADQLISALEHVISKRMDMKQGVAQELLTGRTRLPGFTEPWGEAAIADLAAVDPETLSSGTHRGAEIDYISLEDVSWGDLLGSTRMLFGKAPSRARRIIRPRDVLFGTVRPNLRSHTLYRGGLRRPVASTGFAVVRATAGHDPAFIFRLLMSDMAAAQVDRIIAGSNYPAVSSRDIRALTFLIPAPEEQRAISVALDDIDAEIVALKGRLAKARHVKAGMMQELLTGRTRLPVREAA